MTGAHIGYRVAAANRFDVDHLVMLDIVHF